MKKILVVIILFVVGCFSGILSAIIANNLVNIIFYAIFCPGLVFGVFMALCFWSLKFKQHSPGIFVAWICSSIGAYVIAFFITFLLSFFVGIVIHVTPLILESIFFLIGGFIGALLLGIFFKITIISLKRSQLFLLGCLGGFLGLLFILHPDGLTIQDIHYSLLNFAIWQGGIAALLGYFASRNASIPAQLTAI